ncbi:hypothetical protein C1645_735540 [Glomus cerebriforme]|uniref:Uncharacterized protein n=1 Tax=Glomus cerebriforme TaxID=658196 RepID=A0A397T956_9GLOM|nr:hypothetical protein C1645_735540 [Glomus cerebriforme]
MNKTKAFEWYMKSAIAGCANGQCKGTKKNKKKAFEWYSKSANAECAEGQYNLGFCYDIAEDEFAIAQDYIGDCYLYGDEDIDKAIYWYEKALYNGIEAAKYTLDDIH